ncbi:hypothetical protein FJTKL_08371 [Diaporthe vaccinii]|uniref:Uncharacterized protein n=1 Tax=Diaporthe vaccinii TaxID=105482 RepID=A0ABR4ERS0_9PEZI
MYEPFARRLKNNVWTGSKVIYRGTSTILKENSCLSVQMLPVFGGSNRSQNNNTLVCLCQTTISDINLQIPRGIHQISTQRQHERTTDANEINSPRSRSTCPTKYTAVLKIIISSA